MRTSPCHTPNEMWGTDGVRIQTVDDGLVWVFAGVDGVAERFDWTMKVQAIHGRILLSSSNSRVGPVQASFFTYALHQPSAAPACLQIFDVAHLRRLAFGRSRPSAELIVSQSRSLRSNRNDHARDRLGLVNREVGRLCGIVFEFES